MGHAVPMPVVVKTRNYDEAFYESILSKRNAGHPSLAERLSGGGKRRL